jgi:co-chaperonin GroES (HSP10)
MNIKPQYDYLLCERISEETGVITENDIEDTHQKYKVLAVGEGRHEYGVFITPKIKPNNIIFVQKHSEADTPKQLKDRNLALIMSSRVMAILEDK